MAKLIYCCRVCKKNFPRENLLGRLPRACPEHRGFVKALNDRTRNREGQSGHRPMCCAQLAPGKVCDQHKQWKDFKQIWVRRVKPGEREALVLADLFLPLDVDGSTQNSGVSIVTMGRDE